MLNSKDKSEHLKKILHEFEIPGASLYDKTHKICTYSVCIYNWPSEKFQRKSNMKLTTRCFPKKKVLYLFINTAHFPKIKEQCIMCKKTQRATQVSATWYTFKGTLDYRHTDIRYRNNNLLTMPSNSVAKKKSPKKVSVVKVKNWKVAVVWP